MVSFGVLRKRATQLSIPTIINPTLLIVGMIVWAICSRDWSPFTIIPILLPSIAICLSYWYNFSPPRVLTSTLSQMSAALALSTWIVAPIVLSLQAILGIGLWHLINQTKSKPAPVPVPRPLNYTMFEMPEAQSIALVVIWSLLASIVETIVLSLLVRTHLDPTHLLYSSQKFAHLQTAPATMGPFQRQGDEEMVFRPGGRNASDEGYDQFEISQSHQRPNNNNIIIDGNISNINSVSNRRELNNNNNGNDNYPRLTTTTTNTHHPNPFISPTPVFTSQRNNNNNPDVSLQRRIQHDGTVVDLDSLSPTLHPQGEEGEFIPYHHQIPSHLRPLKLDRSVQHDEAPRATTTATTTTTTTNNKDRNDADVNKNTIDHDDQGINHKTRTLFSPKSRQEHKQEHVDEQSTNKLQNGKNDKDKNKNKANNNNDNNKKESLNHVDDDHKSPAPFHKESFNNQAQDDEKTSHNSSGRSLIKSGSQKQLYQQYRHNQPMPHSNLPKLVREQNKYDFHDTKGQSGQNGEVSSSELERFEFSKHLPTDPYEDPLTNQKPIINTTATSTTPPKISTTVSSSSSSSSSSSLGQGQDGYLFVHPSQDSITTTSTTHPPQQSQHQQFRHKQYRDDPNEVVLPDITPTIDVNTFTDSNNKNKSLEEGIDINNGNEQFVSIHHATSQPLFKLYQIEHPTYKSRLLGLVIGFTTALLFFQMFIGSIYLITDKNVPNSLSPAWGLSFALTIIFFPLFLITYQTSLVIFVSHFYHYYPYNQHTNRHASHSSITSTSSLFMNLIYPCINLMAFMLVNSLLLTRLISNHYYITIPIFASFNLLFTFYLLGVVMSLELSSLPINFHCTGSLTHPTAKDMHQYHPLMYIPPSVEDVSRDREHTTPFINEYNRHDQLQEQQEQQQQQEQPQQEQQQQQQQQEQTQTPPSPSSQQQQRQQLHPQQQLSDVQETRGNDEEEGRTEGIGLPGPNAFLNVLADTCRYVVI